ncbi:MalY/PatB family protein [Fundicoccus culcitae]|uniref:cysteine-S-conjugate beta-lyase n=1 Tax=Fundicoccus culcitae TaxID=2969821 RepID=A0ABY5P4W3_9LACT|nr:MalY/PatB family protein [Fundicoccus culcitae]UUX33787.1 pyridoxal phosphate-dependent aminotransferase [Fundicoccus culcitae]
MYDFDKFVDRKGTWSMKWDAPSLEETFGNTEVLPLWVADMDFPVAPAIKEALQKIVDHGIFGYTVTDEANEALAGWMERRHNWKFDPKVIVNTPGIVFALNVAVQTYSRPGDKVLIQSPVYYPFTNAIVNNGRKVVSNDMVKEGDNFVLDLTDFEVKAKDPNTSMFIMCSPHNPLSKVFTADELKKMLDIAFENDLTVVVDEIHGDLIMPGVEYTTVGNLGAEYANKVITCLAPSKSFNLAGIQWSGIVIPDEKLRHQFSRSLDQLGYGMYNPFSYAATVAAYNDSEDWLNEVIDYVYKNYLYLKETLESELDVHVLDLEATYLAFVDFSRYGLTQKELENKVINEAKVGLDSGTWFGENGAGFMRFNLACSRSTLEEAVSRVVKVFK